MGVNDSIPRNGEQDMNEKKHWEFRNSVQIGGNENGNGKNEILSIGIHQNFT